MTRRSFMNTGGYSSRAVGWPPAEGEALMIATTAQAMTNTTTRARWTAAAYILGALLCGLSTAVARLAGRPGGIAENLDRVESIAAAIVAGPLFGLLIGGTVKLFYRPTSLARWMFWASVVVMVSQGMGR